MFFCCLIICFSLGTKSRRKHIKGLAGYPDAIRFRTNETFFPRNLPETSLQTFPKPPRNLPETSPKPSRNLPETSPENAPLSHGSSIFKNWTHACQQNRVADNQSARVVPGLRKKKDHRDEPSRGVRPAKQGNNETKKQKHGDKKSAETYRRLS